ncbi:perC transcriptional activator family protein [Candidatus Erwinia dacicola]|uniref:PerC transcriptional activator family protein n=2 Tax=Candidatus Erwinia dacicola TaxID=252393 RepID=A0A328TR54_9GAMM|nr:perC transcriptional activator family protein [Candidatus Erwinia dacicola]
MAGGGNQLRGLDQMKKTKIERYHEDYVSQRRVERVVAVTPEAMEIESRAIERERRGHYRIAARLWLQCLDAAIGEVERARIAVRRQQCITKGNRTQHLDYSGIGCRGVVYD